MLYKHAVTGMLLLRFFTFFHEISESTCVCVCYLHPGRVPGAQQPHAPGGHPAGPHRSQVLCEPRCYQSQPGRPGIGVASGGNAQPRNTKQLCVELGCFTRDQERGFGRKQGSCLWLSWAGSPSGGERWAPRGSCACFPGPGPIWSCPSGAPEAPGRSRCPLAGGRWLLPSLPTSCHRSTQAGLGGSEQPLKGM